MPVKPMHFRNFCLFVASAMLLSACARRGDAVFSHFDDLEAKFTQNTNEWQLAHHGSGSTGDGVAGGNSANAFLVLKRRVDTGRFRTSAAKLIQEYIVSQGGVVVHSEETAGNLFNPDYRSEEMPARLVLLQARRQKS